MNNRNIIEELGEDLYNELQYTYGAASLSELDPALRTKEICMAMLGYHTNVTEEIKLLPKEFASSSDFYLEFVNTYPNSYTIAKLPEPFSSDPNFYLELFKKNISLLKSIPVEKLIQLDSKMGDNKFFIELFKLNSEIANPVYNKYLIHLKENVKAPDRDLNKKIREMENHGFRAMVPWRLDVKDPITFKFFKSASKEHIKKYNRIPEQPRTDKLIDPATAIINNTYYSGPIDDLLVKQNYREHLNSFSDYSKSPLMAPVLYVLALAALNEHKGSHSETKKKPLKVVIYDDHHMQHVVTKSDSSKNIESIGGVYTHKSSIYSVANLVQNIYHESTHMVANEVFRNFAKPYRSDDKVSEQKFDAVVLEVKDALPAVNKNAQSPNEKRAYEALAAGFSSSYTKAQWGIELIVKVPEILSILGYNDGYKWLQTNAPSLLEYYEKSFLSECLKFLSEQHVELYLTLSDDFKSTMNTAMGSEAFTEYLVSLDSLKEYAKINTLDDNVIATVETILGKTPYIDYDDDFKNMKLLLQHDDRQKMDSALATLSNRPKLG